MSNREIPSPETYLDAVFGPTGYLSHAFPGYRPREGQVALAHAVDRSIRERTHLLAEGPTGTGKSLAYAAPASYYAAKTGRSVLIVTANIALQEQIVNKDLPLLQKLVPWPFTFALAKGRSNYLCLDKLETADTLHAANGLFRDFGGDSAPEVRRQLPVVYEWAKTARYNGFEHGETGDISDLPFEPLSDVWRQFSVTANECKKDGCKFNEECFGSLALAKARQSNIIVTNYHLLYAHLKVFAEIQQDVVLSPFEVVILDEAHKAAEIARDFFGDKVTADSVKRLARKLTAVQPSLATELELTSGRFFQAMSNLKNDKARYKARLTGDYQPHEKSSFASVKDALGRAGTHFQAHVGRLDAELTAMAEAGSLRTATNQLTKEAKQIQDERARVQLDFDRCVETIGHLTNAMEKPGTTREHVYFLEEHGDRKAIAVVSKLMHPSDFLTPNLFNKLATKKATSTSGPEVLGPVSVAITSATLATDAGSFDYVAKDLGVERYHELIAESPFQWAEQARFVCPETMCMPDDPEFREAVARHVGQIVAIAGGRTLGLFTSRRALEHTYDKIVGDCRRQKIAVLKQGDAPRTKLVEQFKTDRTSVLLGLESFWAGVDAPGDTCSVVIIDRLPFPTPDDPVLSMISNENDRWFWDYAIPRAIIQFKQGFGRLIRAAGDRGVVVCLDRRLIDKKYAKQFLRAIPNCPKSTKIETIAEWLYPPPAPAWDAL